MRQNGRCAANQRYSARFRMSHKMEDGMFEGLVQPMHLMIIAGIALLIFGPRKLPELGKGLGESIRGFKTAMAAKEKDEVHADAAKPDAGPTMG